MFVKESKYFPSATGKSRPRARTVRSGHRRKADQIATDSRNRQSHGRRYVRLFLRIPPPPPGNYNLHHHFIITSAGFPHRMRFKAFNARYKLLAPSRALKKSEDKAIEDCKVRPPLPLFSSSHFSCLPNSTSKLFQIILEYFAKASDDGKISNVANNWALGKRHIFLGSVFRLFFYFCYEIAPMPS